MRHVRKALMLLLFLTLPALAFAQDGSAPASSFDWRELAAVAINSVGVLGLVQLAKKVLPYAPGGVKQILALVAGPLLMAAQNALSEVLGFPIDLSPLITVASGMGSSLVAMGLFDVGKRLGKR